MAGIIDGPWNPALDGNGDEISGSVIEFKVSGTSTAQSAYPTAADAEAGTNAFTSKTADSAGRFTPTYVPDGSEYRVVWKTSASGSTIATYDNVRPAGFNPDELEFDFDSNGRFKLSGSGGLVHLEIGDPSGDDSGGDGRIGGWNGTALTTLEVESAETDFTGEVDVAGGLDVVGAITGLAGLPVALYREAGGSTTSGTSLDITLDTDTDLYLLVISAWSVGTDQDCLAYRVGFGAPTTIRTTDYSYIYTRNSNGTLSGATAASAAAGLLTTSANSGVTNYMPLVYWIDTRGGSVKGGGPYFGDVGAGQVRTLIEVAGWNEGNTGQATSLRILTTDGSFAVDGAQFSLTYTLFKCKTHVAGQSS